jgi:nitrite reductase (NADH) small subunit
MPGPRRICPAAELEAAGSMKIVEIDDRPVVVRNVEGTLHAIENICPHRGGPVGEGDVQGNVIVCPWHDWAFDLSTGQNTMNPAATLTMFPCRIEDGWVVVEE